MKESDKITVNGKTSYFVGPVLEITCSVSDSTPLELYTRYQDGSTKRYGVSVQDVKDYIDKGFKIMVTVIGKGSIVRRHYITSVECYQDNYQLYVGQDVFCYVCFYEESEEEVLN